MTQEEMRDRWYERIPETHDGQRVRARRIDRIEYVVPKSYPQQTSDGMKRYRDKQRKAYVAECIPRREGDAEILQRYASGERIKAIAMSLGCSGKPKEITLRIEACHPRGLTINKAFKRR